MLRLTKTIKESEEWNITKDVISERITLDSDIWNSANEEFGRRVNPAILTLQICRFESKDGQHQGYIYQDEEANREMRMLEELSDSDTAYQFGDVYPDIKKVIIIGCNELACRFAEYLGKRGVEVQVSGAYWGYFGYNSIDVGSIEDDAMVIYAEGTEVFVPDTYSCKMKSISPEFECIDKIYEKNVLDGRITDSAGDFAWLIKSLRREGEQPAITEKSYNNALPDNEGGYRIFIIGIDKAAQDAYDMLYEQGVDISGFVRILRYEKKAGEKVQHKLLCKNIYDISDVIKKFDNPVFINCHDSGSALGVRDIEYLYGYGYRRNKSVFLIKDYTEVVDTNLIHILRDRDVLLIGDEQLCGVLAQYLEKVEDGHVNVRCPDLHRKVQCSDDDIILYIYLRYDYPENAEYDVEKKTLDEKIKHGGITEYNTYFTSMESFCKIEQSISEEKIKYADWLRPKAIVISKIPSSSGNGFMDGIIDGHPEIIYMGHGYICNNMFMYCMWLSRFKSSEILEQFWKKHIECDGLFSTMYKFKDGELFDRCAERLLSRKERFTSQEIFVILHMAYYEMCNNGIEIDIREKVIWLESHHNPKRNADIMAKWLESSSIKGYTYCMIRDNCVRVGSVCGFAVKTLSNKNMSMASSVLLWNGEEMECKIQYEYWKEIRMRFEDVKLHPKEMLTNLCKQIGIEWSDTMLHTTDGGRSYGYRGSLDFDLQPVLRRSEKYLSEFDRMRIYILSRKFQRRYGYPYEDSRKFTRRELQDMFLKEFRFYRNIMEENPCNEIMKLQDKIRWRLWQVREEELTDDAEPIFKPVHYGQSTEKSKKLEEEKKDIWAELLPDMIKKARAEVLDYVNNNDKVIIYGIGQNCDGLMKYLGEDVKSRLLFADEKADTEECTYMGKTVISPTRLASEYKEYQILVTPSLWHTLIRFKLENMGIESERIFCNVAMLCDVPVDKKE